MYDLIGDIHGFADKLTQLLTRLGYRKRNGTWSHTERKVIFLGDYIDRGPCIPETLRIIRSMTESGSAVALMGNHEYNALLYHLNDDNGSPLRSHSDKNLMQHSETLRQFQDSPGEYEDYLIWMLSLPLFFETDLKV
jgi:hypothetical protein